MTGYRIIKKLCKLKSSGIKKIFEELPILECDGNYNKTTAEVFKPMLKSQSYKTQMESSSHFLICLKK